MVKKDLPRRHHWNPRSKFVGVITNQKVCAFRNCGTTCITRIYRCLVEFGTVFSKFVPNSAWTCINSTSSYAFGVEQIREKTITTSQISKILKFQVECLLYTLEIFKLVLCKNVISSKFIKCPFLMNKIVWRSLIKKNSPIYTPKYHNLRIRNASDPCVQSIPKSIVN